MTKLESNYKLNRWIHHGEYEGGFNYNRRTYTIDLHSICSAPEQWVGYHIYLIAKRDRNFNKVSNGVFYMDIENGNHFWFDYDLTFGSDESVIDLGIAIANDVKRLYNIRQEVLAA